MPDQQAIANGPGAGPPVCSNAPVGGPMVGREPGQSRAAATNRWTKKVLNVVFLDADANAQGQTIRDKVKQHVPEWSQYANLQFTFDDGQSADILVQTQPGGGFGYTIYQSYHGTDSQGATQAGQPSMWLLFPPGTAEAEFKRVILHEFGHAIGLIHEHLRPDAGIVWNEQAVYQKFAYTGWPQSKIKQQVMDPFAGPIIDRTAFDDHSIMIYPIAPGLANITVDMTWDLSPMDKSFIGRLYPFDVPAIPEKVLHVGAAPMAGAIQSPGQVARYRFKVDSTGTYVLETQGSMAVLMGLYSGPEADEAHRLAADDGSGQEMNAKIVADLQPGTYYAEVRHQRNSGTGEYTITLGQA